MKNVGMLNSRYLLGRYNTDHSVSKNFLGINECQSDYFLKYSSGFFHHVKTAVLRSRLHCFLGGVSQVFFPDDNIDLYYHYGSPTGVDFVKSRRFLERPLIVTTGYGLPRNERRQGPEFLRKMALEFYERLSAVDCLHFHTNFSRDLLQAQLPEHDILSRSVAVPFFLPHLESVSDEQIRSKFNRKEFRIAFVGRDGARKGIKELARAMDLLADHPAMKNVHLTVISADSFPCQRWSRVEWLATASRPHVLSLLSNSNLFVLPTKIETYGLAFVEAMARGCCLISDDDPLRDEIVGLDGIAGYRVPCEAADMLADTILKAVTEVDSSLGQALAYRNKFKRDFHWSAVVPQYVKMFGSVL